MGLYPGELISGIVNVSKQADRGYKRGGGSYGTTGILPYGEFETSSRKLLKRSKLVKTV